MSTRLQNSERKTFYDITFLIQQFPHHLQKLHCDDVPELVSHHVLYPREQTTDTDECRYTAAPSEPSTLSPSSSRELFRKYQQRRICVFPAKITVELKYIKLNIILSTCNILSRAIIVPDLPTPALQ